MIEHHIQKDIITRLAGATSLRFSELKPEDMESNTFMYHLKQLIAGKYVVQQDDKTYRLTPQGLTYVDGLSLTDSRPRQQPKLVSIIVLKNKDGKYLLVKRKLQPTIGTWSLPSGKQHFGESPAVHVEREVKEHFGVAIDLRRRGLMDIRIHHGEVLVTHLVAHVYQGDYDKQPPDETKKFVYEWHAPSEKLMFTPGTKELFETLESEPLLFFLSLDVTAD